MWLGDKYEQCPAMPPTVLSIDFTSMTAADPPFTISRRD
jgi:hypothetical protein